MAVSSLLTLLDDIATILDDVTVMTKIAAKKTAGVLGDDLALNAEQVSGVRPERELPVVWSVFKGSTVNKLILVPAALAISAIAPWLVIYLLMLGGLYLCFEGAEKVWHSLTHKKTSPQNKKQQRAVLARPEIDLKTLESQKIKGAIRTDFVLSAEIIVIALGTVKDAPLANQLITVSLIAAIMTIGVYGLVALIVKLDDIGLALLRSRSTLPWQKINRILGQIILSFCPWLMKSLSIVGTAAMFLVGGGILSHGIPAFHHAFEHFHLPNTGLASLAFSLIIGAVSGVCLLLLVALVKKIPWKESQAK